jgi:hypothetical protein
LVQIGFASISPLTPDAPCVIILGMEDSPMVTKEQLRAAWEAACNAEGIPVESKFVVFGKTPEATAYNKLAIEVFAEVQASLKPAVKKSEGR